jgi:hypothetical protein
MSALGKSIMKNKREFKTRTYTNKTCAFIPEGNEYPSVTTILKVINKPALLVWMQLNGTHKAKKLYECLTPDMKAVIDPLLDDNFWKCGDDLSKEATTIGSTVHEAIENYLRNGHIPDFPKETPEYQGFEGFKKFAELHDLKPIEIEKSLASNVHKYAGKVDLIVKIDGNIAILDFKTNKADSTFKGFYPEIGFQLEAYRRAYEEETGAKVTERWAIRVDKLTGEFDKKQYTEDEVDWAGFKAAQVLWQVINKREKQAKEKKEK